MIRILLKKTCSGYPGSFSLLFMLLINAIMVLGITACGPDTVAGEVNNAPAISVAEGSVKNTDLPVSNVPGNSVGGNNINIAGNTYYVAKDGADNNPGTAAQPWLTIRKAASTLLAGDTVYVKAGTYNEQIVPSNSGNFGDWITYRAYPGDTVIIDGSGLSIGSTGLIYINGKSYIEVDGFQVLHSSYVGGLIWGASHHITFKNLIIKDTQRSGISASFDKLASNTVSDITVSGSNISYTNTDGNWESISFNRVTNFEISNNVIHDVQANKEGIDLKISSSNGSIYNNEVYNARQGIYLDGGPSNIDIYNNKLHNNYVAGIMLGSEGGGSAANINIYNNLIYSNTVGFRASGSSFKKTFSLINNTFYNNEAQEIQISDPGQYQQNVVIRNNILSGLKGPLIQYPDYPAGITIDYNLFYALSYNYNNVYGDSYIQGKDPLFVNPSEANFSLQSSSPAIDAGSAVGAPASDYAATRRPQGQGYDIGAYEYSVPQVSIASIN